MVLALAVAWAPMVQASCCGPAPLRQTALSAPSCCGTDCPSHLKTGERDAAVQAKAVAAPQLRFVDLVTPDGQDAIGVVVRPVLLTVAFHPDDRAFPEARFSLTKTYRL